MILQNISESQDLNSILTDNENLILNKEADKLFKKFSAKLPNFSFDNETVSSYGNFTLLKNFKEFIDFKNILFQEVNFERGKNTIYSDAEIIDFMTDCNLVGKHRFFHYGDVANDPGYTRIKQKEVYPDESTCRKFLDKVKPENINQLKKVNSMLLKEKAEIDGAKEVWLSIDDSVSTLYGNQEKSTNGYNPKRKGAPSYKLKVAFIQDTDELSNISLYPGDVHSNEDFIGFLEETIHQLPRNMIPKGILIDRGFFSEDNCNYLENKQLKYFMKAKMYSTLKKHALSIPEDNWKYVGHDYWISEKRCRLGNWKFERRFIFIRQEVTKPRKNKDQMSLPAMEKAINTRQL